MLVSIKCSAYRAIGMVYRGKRKCERVKVIFMCDIDSTVHKIWCSWMVFVHVFVLQCVFFSRF